MRKLHGIYHAFRCLNIFIFVASAIRARVGVTAGCWIAITWAKVYSMEPWLEALAEIAVCVPPPIVTNTKIFFDDLQFQHRAGGSKCLRRHGVRDP